MATLRDIQRRIRSVQSTQKITKAMKLVAASKFRRAQERIIAARPYATKMRELLGGLAGHTGDETHPLLARRETGRKRLVIITADKGLCGAFNSNILRESLRFLRGAGETSVTLVVVGKKARDFYRRRQFTVKSEMLGFFDRLAYSHAQELSNELIGSYLPAHPEQARPAAEGALKAVSQGLVGVSIQTLPLSEAAEAHRRMENGKVGGRILLTP